MTLTHAQAQAAVNAAQDYATSQGVAISCSVTDGRGFEIVTSRMDGASVFTAGIARAKAQSAVALRRDTEDLASMAEKYPELLPLVEDQLAHRVTTLPGGLVLWEGTEAIGGIGVSGAEPAMDVACAEHARKWLAQ